MISKELLSEVLGREVTNIIIDWNTIHISPYTEKEICPSCGCGIKHVNHRIWACVNNACSVSGDYEFSEPIYSDDSSINIYELAHMCKEWAKDEGYFILSASDGYCVVEDTATFTLQFSITRPEELKCLSYPEPEAVFKACQWIYDNKENNES